MHLDRFADSETVDVIVTIYNAASSFDHKPPLSDIQMRK